MNIVTLFSLKHRVLGLLASLVLFAGAPAQASMDLLFDYAAPKTFSGSGSSMRYHYDGGSDGVDVSLSGWQARSNSYTFRNRTNRLTMNGSGMGMDISERNAEELIDNRGRMELIILEFDEMVSIEQVQMGAVGRDFDFTLLAHTGNGTPTLTDGGFGYRPGSQSKRLLNQGWELIGHHGESQVTTSVNAGGTFSSFWAIGAYTSALTDSSKSFGLLGQGNDYFSLLALTGQRIASATVNEPGTWMLLLLGFALLFGLQRRQRQVVHAQV